MTYALLLLFSVHSGASPAVIYFNSEQLCESTRIMLEKEYEPSWTGPADLVSAKCLKVK